MTADPIIYCLERVTDYREFERFCSAFLVGVGYPELDPLGGTGDDGRDAIIRRNSSGGTTCFAYTVRKDWRTKLASDCKRVHEMGHKPNVFVFVCNEILSASEKDDVHNRITDRYNWTLNLFDLERIRAQIVGSQRFLIERHPSIFTPQFFINQNLSTPKEPKKSNDVQCLRFIIKNCDFFNTLHFTDQSPKRFGEGLFSREGLIEPISGGQIHFYDLELDAHVGQWWSAWTKLLNLTSSSFDLNPGGGIYYPMQRHFPTGYPEGRDLTEMENYLRAINDAANELRKSYIKLLRYVRDHYPEALT